MQCMSVLLVDYMYKFRRNPTKDKRIIIHAQALLLQHDPLGPWGGRHAPPLGPDLTLYTGVSEKQVTSAFGASRQ